MTLTIPATGLQLRSTVRPDATVEVSLATVPTPVPAAGEVVVRVEASPINPSDLGLLFAGADMTTAQSAGTASSPVVTAKLSPPVMAAMAGRAGQSLPVGNEGAGTVVSAGASPEAQALLGKTVAILGGAMYAQYRLLKVADCLILPPGTSAAEGAACFVNPLTVIGMVETMRLEGYSALVHTAAASNLGQMLVKLCAQEGVGLVNVVRSEEQVAALKRLGATHVCNSISPSFTADLVEAIAETGAMLAFDATGGGKLAGQILAAMEVAAVRSAPEYSRYGSTVHKQVYIYGGLDRSPTEFSRAFGMAWGIGGWLLTPFLQKIGPAAAQQLRERVAAEVKTTFASTYTKEVSLAEALSLEEIAVYGRQATGQKYLINPNKDFSPSG
ncbi:MAG: zinc-binding dehydrogenase [Dehalococcoidia bacterium]